FARRYDRTYGVPTLTRVRSSRTHPGGGARTPTFKSLSSRTVSDGTGVPPTAGSFFSGSVVFVSWSPFTVGSAGLGGGTSVGGEEPQPRTGPRTNAKPASHAEKDNRVIFHPGSYWRCGARAIRFLVPKA